MSGIRGSVSCGRQGSKLWRSSPGSVLGVSLLVLGLAAAPAAAGIHGSLTKVPGAFLLSHVACPASGACVAVGVSHRDAQNFSTGVIVPISHGKAGKAVKVHGTSSFDGVACPRAGFCLAIGAHQVLASAAAVIVPLTGGKAGKVVSLPGVFLAGIGCGSAHSCWATGNRSGLNGKAVLVHIVDGRVKKVYPVNGVATFFTGENGGAAPVCSTASSCITVGNTSLSSPGEGMIVSFSGGKLKQEHLVKAAASLTGIACKSATSCTAVGYATSTNGQPAGGLVLGVSHGALGTVRRVSGSDYLGGIACRTAASCFAFGSAGKDFKAVLVPIKPRKPAASVPPGAFFNGIGCGRSSCIAVGLKGTFPDGKGIVYTFS